VDDQWLRHCREAVEQGALLKAQAAELRIIAEETRARSSQIIAAGNAAVRARADLRKAIQKCRRIRSAF